MYKGILAILSSIFLSLISTYVFNQPLLGAIIFLFTQFLVGIYLITYRNKRVDITDIRFALYCIYFLYCIFYPVVTYIGLLPFKPEIIPTTYLFGTSFLGLNTANLIYPVTLKRISSNFVINRRTNKYSVIIHLLLILSFLILARNSGISLTTKIGEISRDEVFESVSQLWVVLVMLINASSLYNIYYFKRLPKFEKYIFVFVTLAYIYVHLQLGNRRDYLPIILAAFLSYGFSKQIKLNFKVISFIVVLFIGSFWITIQRDQNVKDTNANRKIEVAIISNEFVYPMQTLLYTIQDNWNLRYGYTYTIMPWEIMLPRSIYPDKPKSLGAEFVVRTFGKGFQGFAYTPTTEAYLNFGYIGPFIMFIIWGLLINCLIKFSIDRNYWLYYLVIYSLVFDFSRGDFSTFFYQLFVIFLLIFLLKTENFKVKIT